MKNKTLKALGTLERIRRATLTEKASELGELRAMQNAAIQEIRDINATIKRSSEAHSASPETFDYFAKYLRDASSRKSYLAVEALKLEDQIVVKHDEVRDAFVDVKVVEKLAQTTEQKIKSDISKKEQTEMNETILSRYVGERRKP